MNRATKEPSEAAVEVDAGREDWKMARGIEGIGREGERVRCRIGCRELRSKRREGCDMLEKKGHVLLCFNGRGRVAWLGVEKIGSGREMPSLPDFPSSCPPGSSLSSNSQHSHTLSYIYIRPLQSIQAGRKEEEEASSTTVGKK